MPSSSKSKKTQPKPPRGRPAATSAISQPVVEDASYLTALSSFSPSGSFFAYISLAVDKHRLRIYDTTGGQSVAEHILDSARVAALTWGSLEALGDKNDETSVSPSRKRKKREGNAPEESSALEVAILGLSNGQIALMSPAHGRVVKTLSHATCTAAILSVVCTANDHQTIWTSGADGNIRLWNVHGNEMLGSWTIDDRIPCSCLAVRPAESSGQTDILVANHSIRLLSTDSRSDANLNSQKPQQLASFTGHASLIKHLQWDTSQTPANRFVSLAEADRVISIWEVPAKPDTPGKMVASVQLDSDARTIALKSSSASETQTLLTLAASGKVSVFPIPAELLPPASTKSTQHKVSTLLPRSTLATSNKGPTAPQVVAASFVNGIEGRIRIARIVAGIKPVFNVVVSSFFLIYTNFLLK